MTKKANAAVKTERMEAHSMLNFLEALRLVQSGCQLRRAGWPASKLYISRNAKLRRVELVREDHDGAGTYVYAEPWLRGGAIGGPPAEDLLAPDWQIVEDERVPTEDGGERAQAAQLAEIAKEEAASNG